MTRIRRPGIGSGPGGSGPATKQWVDARISIAPDKTNEVGQPHTFTATVQQDDGLTAAQGGDGVTGFAPVTGAPVTISLTASNGAAPSPAGPFSGTTDAAGHFSATFSSTSAGLVIGNATTTFSIAGPANNVTVTRDTDPATSSIGHGPGGTGPATKQYVDAQISIAPDKTNEVGTSHTFTVTVQQDDGLTAAQGGDGVTGFAPVSGATVTTSIANSNGATSAMTGGTCGNASGLTGSGTTNASGQCTIVISSPTAGLTAANASTTFSIAGLTNTVSVTRDTDPATSSIGHGPGGTGPATKQWVDARITITPDKTNEVGTSHTFTVTVQQDDGLTAGQGGDGVTGFGPASGVSVSTFISNSNGATGTMTGGTCGAASGGTGSGTTDANGQCTVIISSPTAGLTTANASSTFAIAGLTNSVTVTRDTIPGNGITAGPSGSGPATKQWVDANITITPADATNPTGANHTFTVTVKQDDGLTAAQGGDGVTGFAPVNGAAVNTTIANSNGATASMNGGTCGAAGGLTGFGITNGAGQCTIIITSPTPGVTVANASTTFAITGLTNTVTVTRDTDPATANIGAGPGGSGPASKLWILTHVRDAQNNDITNQTVSAPALVHDEFTTGSTAGGTPPAGSVTFTLFQSSNCTGTIVQVGGQNTETANVVNGLASSTAKTLNPSATTHYSYLAHYNGDGTFPAQDASCEPFTVRFVDANITIAPDKTNEVGTSHTFTVTVKADDGNGGGLQPFQGATVDDVDRELERRHRSA